MQPLVIVLLDGLGWQAGITCMTCLAALVKAGQAQLTRLSACLPPLSRPAYATLLTGLAPLEHGILRNEDQQPCPAPTIFGAAARAGIVTCAAAYGWFYELCTGAPFSLELNRFCRNPAGPINHGLFYCNDDYPDAELFADGEFLRRSHAPGLLLVHAMGIDYAGHSHGGASTNYADAARRADGLLARYLPLWLTAGYRVIVASDHGMDASGRHYDALPACLDVPFWLVGAKWQKTDLPQSPCEIAGLARRTLGLS